MIQRALRAGLTSSRPDYGEACGEEVMTLSAEPGLESKEHNLYDQAIHLASISDLVCQAVRVGKEQPWTLPKPIQLGNGPMWHSGAYLAPDGSHLRRICLVSGWSDDRHFSEARSWRSIGEVCAYGLPMKQVVVVLGQNRSGKRHGYWSKAVLHPVNRKVRFRKRLHAEEGFKSSWLPIFREDHDEISSQTWLESMLADGVLEDSLFIVDIEVPTSGARQAILDLASRKLERLWKIKNLPDKNLSTCDWPSPCLFRSNCHRDEQPSGRYGFVKVEELLSE